MTASDHSPALGEGSHTQQPGERSTAQPSTPTHIHTPSPVGSGEILYHPSGLHVHMYMYMYMYVRMCTYMYSIYIRMCIGMGSACSNMQAGQVKHISVEGVCSVDKWERGHLQRLH